MTTQKINRRTKIKYRIRKVVRGTNERPRMSVFRSNKRIYVQLINDDNGTTLASASSLEIKDTNAFNIEVANKVGKLIANKAAEKGITQVTFDRNGFLYHGKIKALADGAREAGLKF
ncbi:MAG: 50S ribosomal protein L18 [Cytophagales bacterium]|nr:MAG: 50S ribosomal protein L18 [Cytophagales bacterium]